HTAPPPRVIGGHTPACTEAAAAFYTRLANGERAARTAPAGTAGTAPKIVRARGTREAETVTVLETNLRQVNTALVNELAMVCHDLGVDVWDVLRCAETHPSGLPAHRPGPGPGGPWPAIDPGRLPGVRRGPGGPPRMVESARSVNERMPAYVTERVGALLNDHGKSVRDARILLLGVTHRADTADRTGSPADEIAHRLLEGGARLSYHDPHVPHWTPGGRRVPRADSPHEAAATADLTLLLQAHAVYDLQGLAAKSPLLLDTRGVTPAGAAHRL
ncbi:UDP binding domain-containing protein, partial [Streptomyces alkaliphilus]